MKPSELFLTTQNFARNKNNCFFDKDLALKAEFLKKIWPAAVFTEAKMMIALYSW